MPFTCQRCEIHLSDALNLNIIEHQISNHSRLNRSAQDWYASS